MCLRGPRSAQVQPTVHRHPNTKMGLTRLNDAIARAVGCSTGLRELPPRCCRLRETQCFGLGALHVTNQKKGLWALLGYSQAHTTNRLFPMFGFGGFVLGA